MSTVTAEQRLQPQKQQMETAAMVTPIVTLTQPEGQEAVAGSKVGTVVVAVRSREQSPQLIPSQ